MSRLGHIAWSGYSRIGFGPDLRISVRGLTQSLETPPPIPCSFTVWWSHTVKLHGMRGRGPGRLKSLWGLSTELRDIMHKITLIFLEMDDLSQELAGVWYIVMNHWIWSRELNDQSEDKWSNNRYPMKMFTDWPTSTSNRKLTNTVHGFGTAQ